MVWWGFRALKTPERAYSDADALRRLGTTYRSHQTRANAGQRLDTYWTNTGQKLDRNWTAESFQARRRPDESPRCSHSEGQGAEVSRPPARHRGQDSGRGASRGHPFRPES